GEFPLPALSPGQVYWLQPRLTNGTGREQWSQDKVYAPEGPPVHRRPVNLKYKHKAGASRHEQLINYYQVHPRRLGKEQQAGEPLRVWRGQRREHEGGSGGAATIRIEYQASEFNFSKALPQLQEIPEFQEIQTELKQLLEPILGFIRGVVTDVSVNQGGKMNL